MSSHSYSSFPPHQRKLLSSGHASDRNQKTSEKHKVFTDKPRGENRVFHGNFSDFYCGMLADNQTWTASYSAQFLPNSSHFFRIFPSLTTSLCPVTKSSIQSPVYITSSIYNLLCIVLICGIWYVCSPARPVGTCWFLFGECCICQVILLSPSPPKPPKKTAFLSASLFSDENQKMSEKRHLGTLSDRNQKTSEKL